MGNPKHKAPTLQCQEGFDVYSLMLIIKKIMLNNDYVNKE